MLKKTSILLKRKQIFAEENNKYFAEGTKKYFAEENKKYSRQGLNSDDRQS